MKTWAIAAPLAGVMGVMCILGLVWAAERGLGGPAASEPVVEVSDVQRAIREAETAVMAAQEASDDNRRLQREIDELRRRLDDMAAARAARASAMVELCACGGCCENGGSG